jgi:hypothetical protein
MAFDNGAEGGTSGTTVTTGNTGGGSGTAANTVAIDTGAGGDIEFHTSAALYGALGYRFIHPVSGGAVNRMIFPNGSAVAGRYAIYCAFKIDSVPTAIEDICSIRHSGGATGVLIIAADGKLQLQDSTGATIAASKATLALSPNHWYGVSMTRTKGTGAADGQLGYAYYDLEASGSPEVQSYNNATCNAGTADTTHGAFGRQAGRTQAHIVDMDDLRGDAFAAGYMTPVVADVDVDTYTNSTVFVATLGTPPFSISQDTGASTAPTVVDDGTTSGQGVFVVAQHATDELTYTITDDNSVEVGSLTVPVAGEAPTWPKIPGAAVPTSTWV